MKKSDNPHKEKIQKLKNPQKEKKQKSHKKAFLFPLCSEYIKIDKKN